MNCVAGNRAHQRHSTRAPEVVDEVSGVGWWPGYIYPEHPAIIEARNNLAIARQALEQAEEKHRGAMKTFMDACVLYNFGDPPHIRKSFS